MSKKALIEKDIEYPTFPPILPVTTYPVSSFKENVMSDSTAELVEDALSNLIPSPSRAKAHLQILDADTWEILNIRATSGQGTLVQMYNTLEVRFREENRPFFRNISQFYAMYRQAVDLLGLQKVTRKRKPKA